MDLERLTRDVPLTPVAHPALVDQLTPSALLARLQRPECHDVAQPVQGPVLSCGHLLLVVLQQTVQLLPLQVLTEEVAIVKHLKSHFDIRNNNKLSNLADFFLKISDL